MAEMVKPKLLVNHESFRRLNETPPGEAVTWLVYGGSGDGKTWFMGTAGDRTLFLNTGAGKATLQSPLFKDKVGANPIIVDIFEKYDARGIPVGHAQAFDMLADAIDYGLQTFGDQFDTIAVDDSTATRRYAMSKGLEINQATNKSKTLSEIVEKWDVVSPAVQDYGIEMSLIMQFMVGTIEICKKNNKHLIVGAHERLTFKKAAQIGEPATLVKTRPGFTGQTFPDDITGLFDIVTHAEAVGGSSNIIYRQRFAGDEELTAKCRYAGIFETLETNVNFLKCIERIKAAQLNPKAAFKR